MVPDSHRISQANEARWAPHLLGSRTSSLTCCLLVTASGESHPALKQNSSSTHCMRESGRLQPLCGKFLEKGSDEVCRGWRSACPVSRKRGMRRKDAPLSNLNLDETRGKHASSIFGRSIRGAARKASARSLAVSAKCNAVRLRRNARPHDDEHPKAALRYDAPNPRTAPAIFFLLCSCCTETGPFRAFLISKALSHT